MDPDPAARRAGRGGRRGPAEAGRGPARRPGPAGGGVEVLACIVPGREPCFFLPGTPRWRPGARGPKQTGAPGPEERGVAGSPGGGAGSGPGGSVSGAAAPRAHREATGARKAPRGDGSRLRASRSRVSWNEKGTPCPTTVWDGGGPAASTPAPAAVRPRNSEKQARAPRPLRPRPPQRRAPRPPYSPLARLRAFSGLWK